MVSGTGVIIGRKTGHVTMLVPRTVVFGESVADFNMIIFYSNHNNKVNNYSIIFNGDTQNCKVLRR